MVRALKPKQEVGSGEPAAGGFRAIKRRCVSNACVPCRKRKSKCDGGLPVCATCTAVYKTTCFYDGDSESRRQATPSKRNAASMKQVEVPSTSSTAEYLLNKVRSLPAHEIQDFVQQIRDAEDMDALAASFGQKTSLQSAKDSSSQEENLSAFLGKPIFIDARVSRVYGSTSGMGQVPESDSDTGYQPVLVTSHDYWTEVTQDKDLVQHLLQTYFEIYNPFFNFVIQEFFWESFNSGKTRFCSPLLVNACCALACHSSDRPAARVDPKDPRTAGDHFFQEARRLLYVDEMPCLTTIQALAILALREPAAGRDSSGYMFAGRFIRMALELGIHLQWPGPGKLSADEDEVRRRTFWSCFNFEVMWGLCVGRITQMPRAAVTAVKPPLPKHIKPETTTSIPSPNPSQSSKSPLQDSSDTQTVLHYVTSLSELANENVFVFYAPRERFTSRVVLDCYRRYQSWYKTLPKSLRYEEIDETAPPSRSVLELMMWYQACIIMLFRPLIKVSLRDSDLVPRELCLEAADRITFMMKVFRNHYTLNRIMPLLTHINLSCSMIHLININLDDARTHLIQDMRNLEEMSDSAYFAARAFRMICSLAKQWRIEIPPEILANSSLVAISQPLPSPIGSNFVTTQHMLSTDSGHLTPESSSGQEFKAHPYTTVLHQSTSPVPLQGLADVPSVAIMSHSDSLSPPASCQGQYTSSGAENLHPPLPSRHSQQGQPVHLHRQHPYPHSQTTYSGGSTPNSHQTRPLEDSPAQYLFWTPFVGNSTPLLGNNFNVSPMDLSNMMDVNEWDQFQRDGFRLHEWNHQSTMDPGMAGPAFEAVNKGGHNLHHPPHPHVPPVPDSQPGRGRGENAFRYDHNQW